MTGFVPPSCPPPMIDFGCFLAGPPPPLSNPHLFVFNKTVVLLVQLERVLNMTTCTCMYVHYTMQGIIRCVQYDRKQI